MQIAILSDIHDHIALLRTALARLEAADALICCGDLCSPFIVKELGEGFLRDIHVVFGNNDGDRFRITQNAAAYPHLHLHGEYVELDFEGRTFAVQHFHDIGRALAGSDAFDVVCFGHDHRFAIERRGEVLVINPGEVCGLLTGEATCVLYDTQAHEAHRIDLA